MTWGLFFLCPRQEVLLRGFQCASFLDRSIFLKVGTVYDRPSNMWAKPSPTEGKPGRMPISSRLKVFSCSDMDIHPLCGLPFHVFRQVPFLFIQILGDFSQICLHLCLPPFLRLSMSRIRQSCPFWAPGFDRKVRSSLLFSGKISSPVGSIFPENPIFFCR